MAYKARTISGAQTRVRQLERIVKQMNDLLGDLKRDRRMLAKLAADGPAFLNPLHVYEAKQIRDRVLERECNLRPDGRPL